MSLLDKNKEEHCLLRSVKTPLKPAQYPVCKLKDIGFAVSILTSHVFNYVFVDLMLTTNNLL